MTKPKIHVAKSGKKYFVVNRRKVYLPAKLTMKEIMKIYKLLLKSVPRKVVSNKASAVVNLNNAPRSRRRPHRSVGVARNQNPQPIVINARHPGESMQDDLLNVLHNDNKKLVEEVKRLTYIPPPAGPAGPAGPPRQPRQPPVPRPSTDHRLGPANVSLPSQIAFTQSPAQIWLTQGPGQPAESASNPPVKVEQNEPYTEIGQSSTIRIGTENETKYEKPYEVKRYNLKSSPDPEEARQRRYQEEYGQSEGYPSEFIGPRHFQASLTEHDPDEKQPLMAQSRAPDLETVPLPMLKKIVNQVTKDYPFVAKRKIAGKETEDHYRKKVIESFRDDLVTPTMLDSSYRTILSREGRQSPARKFFQDKVVTPTKNIFRHENRVYPTRNLFRDGKGKSDVDGLYDDQIDQVMSHYKEYLGTIMSDQIKNLLPLIKPQSRVCFIINTDPSSKSGTHWCGVFIDARNGPESSNSLEYYDSFARPIPPAMLDDLKLIVKMLHPENLLKIKENRVIAQKDSSSNCGWFCLRFLIDRLRGKSFSEATGYDERMKIDLREKNEKEIERMKNQAPFKYLID